MLQNLIRWLVSPRIKQINTTIHLSYGTPAASVDVAADAALWEVFWRHRRRPPVILRAFSSVRAPHRNNGDCRWHAVLQNNLKLFSSRKQFGFAVDGAGCQIQPPSQTFLLRRWKNHITAAV